MKLTKAERTLLDGLRTKGHVFEWYDILTVPNGAVHLTTQENRNMGAYCLLRDAGLIRRASPEEIAEYCREYKADTDMIIRAAETALAEGDWKLLKSLASDLEWLTGDGYPDKERLYTLTEKSKEVAA